VGAGQVPGGPDEPVVVQHVQDAGDRDQHVVLGDDRLGLATAAALAAPVAVAEPVPVTAPAGALVVVAVHGWPALATVPAAITLAAVTLATVPAAITLATVTLATVPVALVACVAAARVVPPAVAAPLLAARAAVARLAVRGR